MSVRVQKPQFGSEQWRVSMCSFQFHLPCIKTTAQVVRIKGCEYGEHERFSCTLNSIYSKQAWRNVNPYGWQDPSKPPETESVCFMWEDFYLWFQMDRGNCGHYKKHSIATVNICYYSQHDSPVFVLWRFVLFFFFTYRHCVWYISHPHAQSAFGQIHTYYK